MNAIDTNVWVYSHDPRDPQKRRKAQELINGIEPLALLWQVGCEFIAAARKLEPFGFTAAEAWDALEDMQVMADAVLLPEARMWSLARELQAQRMLQFWDALLLAGCVSGGVRTLYSENFSQHRVIAGVRIINPFSPEG